MNVNAFGTDLDAISDLYRRIATASLIFDFKEAPGTFGLALLRSALRRALPPGYLSTVTLTDAGVEVNVLSMKGRRVYSRTHVWRGLTSARSVAL